MSCRAPFCSTPCGINEVVTRIGRQVHLVGHSVLNALRHQRSCHAKPWRLRDIGSSQCSTPCGINEVVTCPSRIGGCRDRRAQRLAASTKLSQRQRAGSVQKRGVLNALRHQRSCHLTRAGPAPARLSGCSTPCGINEVVTAGQMGRRSVLPVLNALRHQRSCHRPGPPRATQGRCAQRLAASTKLSHQIFSSRDSFAPRCAQRLAASTKLSRKSIRSTHRRGSSAQRLAASTKLSLRRRPVVPRGDRKGAQRLAASTKLSLLTIT